MQYLLLLTGSGFHPLAHLVLFSSRDYDTRTAAAASAADTDREDEEGDAGGAGGGDEGQQ